MSAAKLLIYLIVDEIGYGFGGALCAGYRMDVNSENAKFSTPPFSTGRQVIGNVYEEVLSFIT